MKAHTSSLSTRRLKQQSLKSKASLGFRNSLFVKSNKRHIVESMKGAASQPLFYIYPSGETRWVCCPRSPGKKFGSSKLRPKIRLIGALSKSEGSGTVCNCLRADLICSPECPMWSRPEDANLSTINLDPTVALPGRK